MCYTIYSTVHSYDSFSALSLYVLSRRRITDQGQEVVHGVTHTRTTRRHVQGAVAVGAAAELLIKGAD